jgi:predicted ATPase with chaperone activity
MKTLTIKLSDSQHDTLKVNAEATSRTMTQITKEALDRYFLSTALSRAPVVDEILNPHLTRVIKLESTIADMNDRLSQLEQQQLMGFYAAK